MDDDRYETALRIMKGKDPDIDRAFNLLNQSLEEGNTLAAWALGTWYLHGQEPCAKKNLNKAVRYLRIAAKDNVPDALYDLAVCYEIGAGVRKNLRLAMETYLRAALFGDKQSVNEVARCYYYGIGVEKNRRIAKIWYDRSECHGMRE